MRTVEVEFLGHQGPAPGLLLSAAREVLDDARRRGERLVQEARSAAARSVWECRRRARLRMAGRLKRSGELSEAQTLLLAQRLYDRLFEDLQRESLEVAVRIAAQFLETTDTTAPILASRIREAIATSIFSPISRILVNAAELDAVRDTLKSCDIPVQLSADENLSPAQARIETKGGAVLVAWRDEFAALTAKLRNVLDDRLAAIAGGK